MMVNTIHFFLSISNYIYLCTIKFLEGQKADFFMMAMNHINHLYQYHGFQITLANIYGEFELIIAGFLGISITLNTISRD